MKDISIIIPVHQFNETVCSYMDKAFESIVLNKEHYDGNLVPVFVSTKEILDEIMKHLENGKHSDYAKRNNKYIENRIENTDYCSQINHAASKLDCEYFSILEFDDEYTPKWFKMASEYVEHYADVSVFLPINIHYDKNKETWQYANEMVLASSFSNEIGFIDHECLEVCSLFNLTGGIFNREDFVKVGGFKKSIEVAFDYEFLLRLTNKGLKAYVVPKEGYKHMVGRDGSLTDIYGKTYDDEQIQKWYDLAKREHVYDEDRGRTISVVSEEKLK